MTTQTVRVRQPGSGTWPEETEKEVQIDARDVRPCETAAERYVEEWYQRSARYERTAVVEVLTPDGRWTPFEVTMHMVPEFEARRVRADPPPLAEADQARRLRFPPGTPPAALRAAVLEAGGTGYALDPATGEYVILPPDSP